MHDVLISLDIIDTGAVPLSLDMPDIIGFELSDPYIDGGAAEYEGAYAVTPSNERQTLQTKYLKMANDVVIEAIPNNYGLITWNGATLTVS